jgi:uncharacterized protein (TIGR00251 family)|tara:strand:- start:2009 stop:2317 length:309 start_codon:yes stop_codon:yes gene_type:complete
MGVESCIQTTLDGTVIIDIEVQPGSSRQGVVGYNEWRGKLQVAVKADAQKGKANHAVCNVLGKIFSAKVTVISGQTSRSKKINIKGLSSQEIIAILEGLVES